MAPAFSILYNIVSGGFVVIVPRKIMLFFKFNSGNSTTYIY